MSKIVFDSSAILAMLKMENGHEIATKKLDHAIVSTVSFSEVVTVISRRGFNQKEIIKSLHNTFLHLVDFDKKQALLAAEIDSITKKYGLSFGDRACLALAKDLNLPVLTADQAWKKLNIGIKIELIR